MVEVLLRTSTGVVVGERLLYESLAAPAHIDAEIGAVLRRLLRRGELSRPDVEEALQALSRWPIERLAGSELVRMSTQWWDNATVYDALYVAVARLRDARVITVDGALARAPITDVVVENVRVGS